MRAWLATRDAGVVPAKPEDVAWDSPRLRAANAAKEFFGSMILTAVTAGAVLASGQLSVKFDLLELTAGRIVCIALANAFVSLFGSRAVCLRARVHPCEPVRARARPLDR